MLDDDVVLEDEVVLEFDDSDEVAEVDDEEEGVRVIIQDEGYQSNLHWIALHARRWKNLINNRLLLYN